MKFGLLTVVGVPLITPFAGLRLKPLGRFPENSDHVSGAVPPVADAVCEYGNPTVPPGNEVVENDGAAEIAIDNS